MPAVALTILFVLFILLLPWALIYAKRRLAIKAWLSNIVICYIIGILLGNTRTFWLLPLLSSEASPPNWNAVAEGLASGSILLSLPILLFTNDIRKGLSSTGKMASLFFLGIGAAVLGSFLIGKWYADSDLLDVQTAAGMLTGVYTGGTPNMVAVSKALNAPERLFVLLNMTDVLASGVYFLLLLTLGGRLLGFLLPAFKGSRADLSGAEAELPQSTLTIRQKAVALAKGLVLTVGIVSISLMVAMLFSGAEGEPNQAVLWLLLTTLAVALSFVPPVRKLPVVADFAYYLLLVFGIGAGFLANFVDLAGEGLAYLQFNAWVLGLILIFYVLLAKLLGADKETFMFCTTAAILGPPFVAQIAGHLKNKALLPVGLALSLIGLAVGNYAGILVAYLLEWW